jgi:signal transduction histidine kinase
MQVDRVVGTEKAIVVMLEIADVVTPVTQVAQEAERRRIARDLHDGAVQTLSALVAELDYFQARGLSLMGDTPTEMLAKVQAWQSLARESLTSLRETLGALRLPPELEDGLPYAIETLLGKMRDAGYLVELDCEDWPAWLPAAHASNIYNMAREAITNISKHAHASRIQIRMYSFEECLYISITDNGVGIPADALVSRRGSGYAQGLVCMRERATLLGGCVTLESVEGKGTRVDIELPMPGEISPAMLAG